MVPGGADALAMMDAVFGETIVYNGAGLIDEPIVVIWADSAGAPFQGPGNTTRTIVAEVRRFRLPERPKGSDRLLRNGVTWKPVEVLEREDVDAWVDLGEGFMTALRELIFEQVVDRLEAIDGVAEVERLPPGDPISFPALHIFDGGQQPGDSDSEATRYDLSLTIEGYLEQASGAETHSALNALYASVVEAVMTEPPLNGLAETIDEGGLRVAVAPLASERRLGFALDFNIQFPTRRGDPAQPA